MMELCLWDGSVLCLNHMWHSNQSMFSVHSVECLCTLLVNSTWAASCPPHQELQSAVPPGLTMCHTQPHQSFFLLPVCPEIVRMFETSHYTFVNFYGYAWHSTQVTLPDCHLWPQCISLPTISSDSCSCLHLPYHKQHQ